MNYYCEVCDKTLKLGYEKRHLKTKSLEDLSMSIVNRYCVKSPKNGEIKKLLREYFKEYSKKFIFFYITCKWKLHFSNPHTGFISENTEYK